MERRVAVRNQNCLGCGLVFFDPLAGANVSNCQARPLPSCRTPAAPRALASMPSASNGPFARRIRDESDPAPSASARRPPDSRCRLRQSSFELRAGRRARAPGHLRRPQGRLVRRELPYPARPGFLRRAIPFRSSGPIAGDGTPEAEKMIGVLNLKHRGLRVARRNLIENLDRQLNEGEPGQNLLQDYL